MDKTHDKANESAETPGEAPAVQNPQKGEVVYAAVDLGQLPEGPVKPATRKCMQGNKRANTKPELLVRQRLREAGLTGYRLQWKVPGRPDVAWPGKKVALFVNGCFWHRCPHCQLGMPKSNVEYWSVKFQRNVERDARNLAALEEAGWRVHVVWECQLKKKKREETFAELLPKLAADLDKPLRATCRHGDTSRPEGILSLSR